MFQDGLQQEMYSVKQRIQMVWFTPKQNQFHSLRQSL